MSGSRSGKVFLSAVLASAVILFVVWMFPTLWRYISETGTAFIVAMVTLSFSLLFKFLYWLLTASDQEILKEIRKK